MVTVFGEENAEAEQRRRKVREEHDDGKRQKGVIHVRVTVDGRAGYQERYPRDSLTIAHEASGEKPCHGRHDAEDEDHSEMHVLPEHLILLVKTHEVHTNRVNKPAYNSD